MKLLATIRPQDFDPSAPLVDPSNFSHRQAARAVVHDAAGQVGLLHVTKHGYYKLPGGGVEEGEEVLSALQRELLEELGCQAEGRHELGKIVEYRDFWNMKQTSFCYIAQAMGAPGKPAFTQQEQADGFEVVWAPNIAAAIALVETAKTSDDPGILFMCRRDGTFLHAAAAVL